MSGLQERKNEKVVTIPRTDMDHFAELAGGFIEAFSEKNAIERDKHKEEIAFKEKVLVHQKSVFQYKFWLMAGGLLSIVSISAGLIFYLKEPSLGISVLSHTGAVVGGIVAGIGYESGRKK
ncbi:hypothetical protein [Shewanella mangrovisoli]|uniref:DUF2335 domain-containing protein n=1 Tax=Shewanella mangrovisoli TaxID=2864211 RepID=A0ABV4VJF5_9GAMM|nr:hypothetical protein [Vibrio vulnificus]HAU8262109.1 hypothetical protein [Vibrio vulnificus]